MALKQLSPNTFNLEDEVVVRVNGHTMGGVIKDLTNKWYVGVQVRNWKELVYVRYGELQRQI